MHRVEQVKCALHMILHDCCVHFVTIGGMSSVRRCRVSVVVPYEVAGF